MLLLIYWPTQKIRQSYLPYSTLYYKQADDFVKSFIRSVKNAYFLKIVGKNKLELDKLHLRTSQLKKNLLAYQFRFQLSGALPTLMGAIIFIGVVIFNSNFTNMEQGELLFFLYIFYRLSGAIGGVVSALGMVEFNLPYACKATSILGGSVSNYAADTQDFKEAPNKEINYHLVVKGNPFLIEYIEPINVNFVAKQGDFVLINGPSGRGKSTFLLALIGLVNPTKGTITWGDICVKDIQRQNFLNKVGYSGAEPFLHDTNIRENMLYGHTSPNNVSDDDINKALDIAQCTFLLDSEGKRYLIDEKIAADLILSSGEKQRISIARAILREPKIFIFDEATANIDEITEEKIYKGLKRNFPESIIIVVSHKSSTIKLADTLVEFQ